MHAFMYFYLNPNQLTLTHTSTHIQSAGGGLAVVVHAGSAAGESTAYIHTTLTQTH